MFGGCTKAATWVETEGGAAACDEHLAQQHTRPAEPPAAETEDDQSILIDLDDYGQPVCLIYGSGKDIEADGVRTRRYVPARLTPSKPAAEAEDAQLLQAMFDGLLEDIEDLPMEQQDGSRLWEALQGAYRLGRDSLTPGKPAAETDAWAVAVLDAWADKHGKDTPSTRLSAAGEYRVIQFGLDYTAPTRAGARLICARALVAVDPTLDPRSKP